MAKQNYGINDGYRGTVGTVIGYQWRGRWCLRARPRRVHNPRTDRQQHNRQLFKAVWSFATGLRLPLRTSLRQTALDSHMTECNRFMHINKGCFALDGEGRLTVDYENLAVSEGSVAPVGFVQPVVEESTVTIPFEKNPLHLRANSDDEVYVLALCPDLDDYRLSAPAYRRTKSISLTLPERWQGHEVHLYGFVTDYAGRASESIYIGVLMNGSVDNREFNDIEELTLEYVAPDDAVVRVIGGFESCTMAPDELGVWRGQSLGTAQEGGDELLE